MSSKNIDPSKVVLVTHRFPDFDAISSIFGFLHFLGFTIFDVIMEKVRVIFVNQGESYVGQEGELVYIADTGGVYDPENGKFDHHYKEKFHHCALQGMVEYFRGHGHDIPMWLGILTDVDSRVDDYKNFPKDPEFGLWIRMANEEIERLFPGGDNQRLPIRFMGNRPGPEWLVKALKQFPSNIDDHWRLGLGLLMLETWKRVFEKGNPPHPLDELKLICNPQMEDSYSFPENLRMYRLGFDQAERGVHFNRKRPVVVLPDKTVGVEMLALKFFLHISRFRMEDIDLRFAQVGSIAEGVSVIEIGPENRFVVDGHDYSSPDHVSSVGSIFEAMYYHDKRTPLVFWNLVKYAEYMLGNGDIMVNSRTAESIEIVYRSLDRNVRKNMKLIAGQNAPVSTLEFINEIGVLGQPDSVNVKVGIMLLDGFFEEVFGRPEIDDLIRNTRIVESRGLRIGFLPKNEYGPKAMRGYLKSPKHRSMNLDVMVGEFECSDANPSRKFAITILGNTEDVVGMPALQERFFQLDPTLSRGDDEVQGDIFLFVPSFFTMYVQNWETTLTIEDVENEVLACLSYNPKEETANEAIVVM